MTKLRKDITLFTKEPLWFPLSGRGFNACGVIKTAWLLSERLETA